MNELKFLFLLSLIPLAAFSIDIAIFTAVFGLIAFLFFFVKTDKGEKKPKQGKSATDKNN